MPSLGPRWAVLPEAVIPPPNWERKAFEDVADVIAGQSPASEDCNDKGIGLPFLQGNADFGPTFPTPSEWCGKPKKKALPGDCLISVRAPVGEINRSDQEYAIGRGLAALRAKESPDFLFYAIQRWRDSLVRVAQGTTFDAVTARHFAALRVAIPPRGEQEAIARILDAVDASIRTIEGEKLRIQLLRDSHLARAFELAIAACIRPGLVQADLNGWSISSIGSEFDLQTGFTLNEATRTTGVRVKYLRVANVQRGRIDLEDVQTLIAKEDAFRVRQLAKNDILVVEGHADRLQIGRCAIVTAEAAGLTFQNHLYRLRSRGAVHALFGSLWLNSEYGLRYWNAKCSTSSGINTINQRMLKAMKMPTPPECEQLRIVGLWEAHLRVEEAITAKLSALLALRKSLSHDLLTGRVRVPVGVAA